MTGVQTCALPICFPVTILMVRSAYTFDTDAVSNETALDCGDESVTQQCFKDECDINILLAKFAVTGQLPENVVFPSMLILRKLLISKVR